MDMHAAALPPRSGRYTKAEEEHALFPLYRQHLSSCAANLVDASDFRDWLFQHNAEVRRDAWARHERYAEFRDWMRDTKAGGRACCATRQLPNGLSFPENFAYWLDGGRW